MRHISHISCVHKNTVGSEIWCSFLSTHAFLLGNGQTYATRGVPYYRVSSIFMSRIFHPCNLVPQIHVSHFPPLQHDAAFSCLAFSTLATWCRNFMSRIFSVPILIIWLPSELHHPCVQTPVKRDRVVGFKQFCTTFLHISAAYLVFIRSAYF